MEKVSIFDASVLTLNVGDEIIYDSVSHELKNIFSMSQFFKVPLHDYPNKYGLKRLKESELAFVGGTNLLTSDIVRKRQWKYTRLHHILSHNPELILLGTGWQDYQSAPNLLTSIFYRSVLSKKFVHSVRDEYSKDKLKSIGVENVINTGCPTTWRLTREHCCAITPKKANKVVFTLTDYRPDKVKDVEFINVLLKEYESVIFWPQGSKDLEYINSLNVDISSIETIGSNLSSFDDVLKSNNIDFVGTRLHAGIRALQHKKRTLIIGVDNRAIEKKKDLNIPVLDRSGLSSLASLLNSNLVMDITIKSEQIEQWKRQFC
ncbi:polysaccharide pyruvyl transferase family protein [Vibrio owensii]|uniref:polysaccharide pyruvyl transferase family protein n=1 Tax=Vibrio owensii TaxID=696485 RepID=UPI0009965097|nr:polysaccharide pyruvyl transferase family protein [Vibrio owensii]AQW57894.1 hypothetical protein A9237_07080 [Vibrio owensii]